MLFGKLVSLVLVTAILNPICCCNAELFADVPPTPLDPHACCIGGNSEDTDEQELPCESEDKCPMKLEALSQLTQQADVKSFAPQAPSEPDLLWSWLSPDPLAKRAAPISPAVGNDGCFGGFPTALRLHQAKCVYLI